MTPSESYKAERERLDEMNAHYRILAAVAAKRVRELAVAELGYARAARSLHEAYASVQVQRVRVRRSREEYVGSLAREEDDPFSRAFAEAVL